MGKNRHSQGHSSTSNALELSLTAVTDAAAAAWQEQLVVADRSSRPKTCLDILLNAVLRSSVFEIAEDIKSTSAPCSSFRVSTLHLRGSVGEGCRH